MILYFKFSGLFGNRLFILRLFPRFRFLFAFCLIHILFSLYWLTFIRLQNTFSSCIFLITLWTFPLVGYLCISSRNLAQPLLRRLGLSSSNLIYSWYPKSGIESFRISPKFLLKSCFQSCGFSSTFSSSSDSSKF